MAHSRSPPTRGRGSKLGQHLDRLGRLRVAPHTGAWIEASHSMASISGLGRSPPTRGRGSKPAADRVSEASLLVAPHTGAWIEARHCPVLPAGRCGRPPHGGVDRSIQDGDSDPRSTRGRPPHGGVDRNRSTDGWRGRTVRSPPTRGRGSKLGQLAGQGIDQVVAPHTGAWIETKKDLAHDRHDHGRPPHGGVDRNDAAQLLDQMRRGRPPHGGVDRNWTDDRGDPFACVVAPHTGAWIETG